MIILIKSAGSGGNLPLDFPSAGQVIEIVQGSTVYFLGQLPAAAAAAP